MTEVKLDKIGLAALVAIKSLPRGCSPGEGEFESHFWVNCYNHKGKLEDGTRSAIFSNPLKDPLVLEPYQVCRYCHKRSNADKS